MKKLIYLIAILSLIIVSSCKKTKIEPVQLIATTTITDVLNNGENNGKIVVNVTSGTPPYQYKIDDGINQSSNEFTSLVAKTYTIYVTDKTNAILTLSDITVNQPLPISITPTVTHNTENPGNSGLIVLNATGGTPPYEYKLNTGSYQTSNTYSGLTAGSYNVSVKDANGGIKTSTVEVYDGLIITGIEKTDTTLPDPANGTITITVSGGAQPYDYSINGTNYQSSNLFTGLSSGTYTVTCRDSQEPKKSVSETITVNYVPPVVD